MKLTKLIFFILLIANVFTLKAQFSYKMWVVQTLDGNKVNFDFYVQNTGIPFAFRSSNFSIYVNDLALNVSACYLDNAYDGPWSSTYNPTDYFGLTKGNGSNYIVLNINSITSSPGSGTLVPSTPTRIGRVVVPVLNHNLCNSISWRLPPLAIREWNGTNIKPMGTFLPDNNCLSLLICSPTITTLNETACTNYTLNGITYSSSGSYNQLLTSDLGCDSTINLNLTINSPTSSILNQNACSSFTLNGTTYTSSGTYIQTLTNDLGCDSTINLNLTINSCPTTQLTSNSCGKSYSNLTNILNIANLPGAISYEIIFTSTTNPLLTFTKTITTTSFNLLGFSPSLIYNETYNVGVRTTTALGIGQIGSLCNVTLSPEVTQVSGYCGKTYKNLADRFNVFKKEGVLNYKFVFTDLSTNIVSEVIKPQTPLGSYGQISISLTEPTPTLYYNRNYKVEVFAEYVNLSGSNVYGTVFQTCQIQTIDAQVTAVNNNCGKTVTNLADIFSVFPVANAIDYTFSITDIISGVVSTVVKQQPAPTAYQQVQVGFNDFVPVLNYNRNYNINVVVKYLTEDGSIVLGNPLTCSFSISKPVVPTVNGYCGKVYPSLNNQIFSVYKIPNVLNYKFIFTDKASPFNTTQIIVPQSASGTYGQIRISLSNPSLALQNNHDYEVDVYAEYFDIVAGTNLYGDIFANCDISIGAVSKNEANSVEFNNNSISVYPNPSNGIITLTGTHVFENASVKIFNSLGQMILYQDNIFGNGINLDFSNNASGIYFLELACNGELKRIKLIKE